ncbi:hypothetical protein D9756_004441 [Leucocoprinus leucothites]|uniref:Nephrocystin 3-like N-terminal domain-containing protein n=1 Tax=Leucocoprinus leucothites TaxID=201217 RepID=A0A8H5LKR1_9AGAR|nr:hypothetical protein D9756_004441 [Leucoagaricus leucothites]
MSILLPAAAVEVVVVVRLLQTHTTYHTDPRSPHYHTRAWSPILSMSFLPHAHNFVITNSVFVEHPQRGRGIELLYNASRMEGVHDSAANEFAAESLPKTRHSSILEDLSTWAQYSSPPFSSLWIIGPESNLAHLCANKLGDYLAASFFFSRELGVDDPTQFFLTIAYQLALHFPAYEALIDAKIRQSPGLVSKSLKIQFRELIARPFQQLRSRGETIDGPRQIIIVNGLDDCKGDQAKQELLRILTTETESLPFRWLVFTRPDIAVHVRGPEVKSTALPNLDGWCLMQKNFEYGCAHQQDAKDLDSFVRIYA